VSEFCSMWLQEQGDLKLRVRALESERAFKRVAAMQQTIAQVKIMCATSCTHLPIYIGFRVYVCVYIYTYISSSSANWYGKQKSFLEKYYIYFLLQFLLLCQITSDSCELWALDHFWQLENCGALMQAILAATCLNLGTMLHIAAIKVCFYHNFCWIVALHSSWE
jgi:hypothetical protein